MPLLRQFCEEQIQSKKDEGLMAVGEMNPFYSHRAAAHKTETVKSLRGLDWALIFR